MAKESDGIHYAKLAEKGGCRVKFGKGDHIKVYPPGGGRPMIMPRNLKGNGTEYAIIKWLRALGIMVSIALLLYFFL